MTTAVKGGVSYTYRYAGTNQNERTHADAPGGVKYDYVYRRNDRRGLPTIAQVKITSGSATPATAYVEHDPLPGDPLPPGAPPLPR